MGLGLNLGEVSPLPSCFSFNFLLCENFPGGAWQYLCPVRCAHYISTHIHANTQLNINVLKVCVVLNEAAS